MINGGFFNKKKVLIAPLDWGLGHATRCIPIIKELMANDCEVLIAASGAQKALLKEEFPGLVFLELKGYNIQYTKNKNLLPFKMLGQLPKIFSAIRHENKWLIKTIEEHKIDIVISDNRFGFYHLYVHCIYITHQLTIKTGNRFTDWLAQKFHYRHINKYKQCWVPDAAGEQNLAGELSHPKQLPKIPLQYIGPLSRFEISDEEIKYSLLVLISGPEPQRTIFEEMVLQQLQTTTKKTLVVRGLPGNQPLLSSANPAIEIHNHLSSSQLNKAILQSELIVCRSGYTTIMDLVKLRKKAVLVPTPGQTEQEYLVDYLIKQKIFYYINQISFQLEEVSEAVKDFPFKKLAINSNEYKQVMNVFE